LVFAVGHWEQRVRTHGTRWQGVRPEQKADIEQALTSGPLGAMEFAATIDSLVDAWNTRVTSADDRRD